MTNFVWTIASIASQEHAAIMMSIKLTNNELVFQVNLHTDQKSFRSFETSIEAKDYLNWQNGALIATSKGLVFYNPNNDAIQFGFPKNRCPISFMVGPKCEQRVVRSRKSVIMLQWYPPAWKCLRRCLGSTKMSAARLSGGMMPWVSPGPHPSPL